MTKNLFTKAMLWTPRVYVLKHKKFSCPKKIRLKKKMNLFNMKPLIPLNPQGTTIHIRSGIERINKNNIMLEKFLKIFISNNSFF